MINLDVMCIRKSEHLDPNLNTFTSEIAFQNVAVSPNTYAPGAAIGTPHTSLTEKETPKEVEKPKYNLNGQFSITVFDPTEASSYEVGKTYKFSVGKTK